LETNSAKNQNSMRTLVARSKGTEWMVSTYNEWQLRSPLQSAPEKNPSSILHLVRRIDQNGSQFNRAMAFSFKSIIFILGILLLVKSR
jgi:hypothetical protein